MANLDEMRTFQSHWHAYLGEGERLRALCRLVPVSLVRLTAAERAGWLFDQPESARFCDRELVRTVQSSLSDASPAIEPDPQWGWWFDDASWFGYTSLRPLLADRDALLARQAELDERARKMRESDRGYRDATEAIASYEEADREDTAALARLQERRADPGAAFDEAEAAARGIWLMRLLKGLTRVWRRSTFIKRETERLDRSLEELRARVELRSRELERRRAEVAERDKLIEGKLAGPRAAAKADVDAVEQRIVEALKAFLEARGVPAGGLVSDTGERSCDDREVDAVEAPSFDEAVALLNAAAWDVLADWMDAYERALPHELERAWNLQASELTWLEGHDPHGRRHWQLTDDIVELLEDGSSSDSARALDQVLARKEDSKQ